MLIPVVPSFVQGESDVSNLQLLSNAVAFLAVASDFPMYRSIKTASAALTGGTWTTLPFGTTEFDSDSMHNVANGGIQINTQGYYRFEANLIMQAPAAGDVMNMSFLLTVGPNNANFSNGTTLRFGGQASTFNAVAGQDAAFAMADICPYVLYPNDAVVVQCFPAGNASTDTLTNSTGTAGWFSPQMSARWIRTGI